MDNRKKIVCIGIMVLDILISGVDEGILERDNTEVDNIEYLTGGDALNESIIVSALGHDSILMGTVGTDIWGDFILKHLKSRGVDTSSVCVMPELSTVVSTVLIHKNGERNFLVRKENCATFDEKCLNYDVIESSDAVSIGSIFYDEALDSNLDRILSFARKNKALTFGDLTFRKGYTLEKAKGYLPLFDYLVPNLNEAKGLTGETELESIAGKILDYGVKNVVIKLGEKGCYIQNATDKIMVPAFKTDNAVDTTGAGDSFLAGLITGTLEGLDIESAAVFANAAASVNVQGVGATFLKDRAQVDYVLGA